MKPYQSRPVEVWAERWTVADQPPEGVRDVAQTGPYEWEGMVDTAGGAAPVYFGDWVIREATPGKHYPCRPDVFARRYVVPE